MIHHASRCTALLALSLVLQGCSSPAEPSDELVASQIFGFRDRDPQWNVEASGKTLLVEVVTYGAGCHRKGETRVDVSHEALTVSIAPYDWQGTGWCPDILRSFEHSAEIEVSEAGIWRVLLTGRDVSGDAVQFEKVVPVEPSE